MPNVRKKTRTKRLMLTGAQAKQALDPLRPGMPALDSIHDDSVTFKSKPKGPTYRILRTTEVDSYETTPTAKALGNALKGKKAPAAAAIAAALKTKLPGDDNFAGQARRAAKLSIAAAPTENFSDVSKLINSLPTVDSMVKLNIPTTTNSNRVQQENRNVHVSGFLFAASREADNDFHLIVGRDPNATQEMYMTMQLSGLPPAGSPAFDPLNTARSAYKQFFNTQNLPGAGYDFYQPRGPPSLKSRMPTIFEVHPITKIKLGP
jgi:hypothetical protein